MTQAADVLPDVLPDVLIVGSSGNQYRNAPIDCGQDDGCADQVYGPGL